MSQSTAQVVIAAIVCFAYLLVIYRLAKRQQLTFRYAVGWLTLFGIGVLATALLPVTVWLAEQLRVTPSALIAVGGLVMLLIICIQLSISISGLQEQVRTLAERIAELESRSEATDK